MWDDGRPREKEGEEVIGEWLAGALLRYDVQVDHHSHLLGARYHQVGKQGELSDAFMLRFSKLWFPGSSIFPR